jgi:hypothetical protein
MELAMNDVGDVFISKESNTMLRVLSYTGEGFDQNCYCLLETDGNCWNGYHSSLHIEEHYTKLESL